LFFGSAELFEGINTAPARERSWTIVARPEQTKEW